MNKISAFLQTKIDAGDFPSAVYLIAEKGEIVSVSGEGLGDAVVEPKKIKADSGIIYDLASLTKPLITGLICSILIERKGLNLDFPINYYLPDFNSQNEISIKQLLTHTSGFPAWKPFYLLINDRKEVLNFISENFADKALKDVEVLYSDLNFLVLGFLLEKIYGIRLDKIAQCEIFEPLKLSHTWFNRKVKLDKYDHDFERKLSEIAASEKGNQYEKQICKELNFDDSDYKWRGYQIWGEVHDNNCYFMDGVAGHAGLFSNVFEVFKIAQQFLSESTTILKPETCELFRRNLTPKMNQARSMAFQLAETEDSTASEALSKDSFGHLGFTGTSLWIEPSKQRIFILLTNRTHNRKLPLADLKETRQTFHRLATEILG